MNHEKFFSLLDHGFAFCDVVLGWDVKDQGVSAAGRSQW
jgi:glutamine synthetase